MHHMYITVRITQFTCKNRNKLQCGKKKGKKERCFRDTCCVAAIFSMFSSYPSTMQRFLHKKTIKKIYFVTMYVQMLQKTMITALHVCPRSLCLRSGGALLQINPLQMSFHYRGYEIPDKMYIKQYLKKEKNILLHHLYATNKMYVLTCR